MGIFARRARSPIRRLPSAAQQAATFELLLTGADAIVRDVFGELLDQGRATVNREVGRVRNNSREGRRHVEWADFSIEPANENSAGIWFSFNGFGNQVDIAIAQSSWDHWEDDSRDLLAFIRDACVAARDGGILEQATVVDGETVGSYAEFPASNGIPWSVEVNDFRRGPENEHRSYAAY